jgi:hypothetical protein
MSLLTLDAAAVTVGKPLGGQQILGIVTELGPAGVPGHRRLAREMATWLAPELRIKHAVREIGETRT